MINLNLSRGSYVKVFNSKGVVVGYTKVAYTDHSSKFVCTEDFGKFLKEGYKKNDGSGFYFDVMDNFTEEDMALVKEYERKKETEDKFDSILDKLDSIEHRLFSVEKILEEKTQSLT